MAKAKLEGADLKELNRTLMEFFSPGHKIELILGLPRDVSDDEVYLVEQKLRDADLQVHSLEAGSIQGSPALRLVFTRPSRVEGIAAWPLVVLIPLILGGLGITAFTFWKVGGVIDALAKYIVPITLIGVGGLVLAAYVMRPVATRIVETGPKYIEAAKGR